jgi:hypothetical protein
MQNHNITITSTVFMYQTNINRDYIFHRCVESKSVVFLPKLVYQYDLSTQSTQVLYTLSFFACNKYIKERNYLTEFSVSTQITISVIIAK